MAYYNVQLTHAIAPSPNDRKGPIWIRDGAFAGRSKLGRALQQAGILGKNDLPLTDMRVVDPDKVVVFPKHGGLDHQIDPVTSLTLTPASREESVQAIREGGRGRYKK